jgi:hypothetical protein
MMVSNANEPQISADISLPLSIYVAMLKHARLSLNDSDPLSSRCGAWQEGSFEPVRTLSSTNKHADSPAV